MLVIVSGLSAGTLHVVAGPDHLAALAPLAMEQPRRAAELGFRWGLGHGLGAFLLGLIGIGARHVFDLQALSDGAEFLVGFALIAVGVWVLARRNQPHTSHSHGGKTFLVGMLHGMAGTGHLLAVVPSLALEPVQALFFLSAYFLAAVAVMTAFGAGLGRVVGRLSTTHLRGITNGAGVLAIVLGVIWVVLSWPGGVA